MLWFLAQKRPISEHKKCDFCPRFFAPSTDDIDDFEKI